MRKLLLNKFDLVLKRKNRVALIVSLAFHCFFLIFLGNLAMSEKKMISLPVRLVTNCSTKKKFTSKTEKTAKANQDVKSQAKTVPKKQVAKAINSVAKAKSNSQQLASATPNNSASAIFGETSGEAVSASSGDSAGAINFSSKNYVGEGEIEDIEKVVVIHKELPKYPIFSRKMREEGTVLLLLTVKNGRVCDVTIEKTSGFSRLDSAAIQAAKKWHFKDRKNFKVKVPFSFKLSN